MKKSIIEGIYMLIGCLLFTNYCLAGTGGDTTITRGKYTLVFTSADPSFSPATKQQLIGLFFKVYPKEAEAFNPAAPTTVTWHIDGSPLQGAPSGTGGDQTFFNPDWFKQHPEDIDQATYELMHIVQAYGPGLGTEHMPQWLFESIGDYARYRFGISNVKADWTLTPFAPGQSYTNSYRITARFLVWLEKHKDKDIVKQLDAALRAHTYTADTWKTLTGETVDQLWKDYAADPAVELEYDTNK